MTTTKLNRKTRTKQKQLSKHDAWLLKKGVHPEQIKHKKVLDLNWVSEYNDTLKVDRTNYVSAGIEGNCPKAPEKVYTGGNLVGIATMHKSNMVPIFAENKEAAADIAKMRR
jgi:hypothetical protein